NAEPYSVKTFLSDILPFSRKSIYFTERQKAFKKTKIHLRRQPTTSKVAKQYYNHPKPYQHTFNRLINEPYLCSQHDRVFILYAIHTIYKHRDRREVLRDNILNPSHNSCAKDVTIKLIFLFAKTDNSTEESLIQKESERYHDIIQEDFQESYANVPLKTVMAWKWSIEFCANAEYVTFMNDEALFDQHRLVAFLGKDYTTGPPVDHFSLCYPLGNGRAAHLHIKQFRELNASLLYQGKYYPPYCHGVAYVVHINIVNKLYRASAILAPFMPTDVWFGVLGEMLGLKVVSHSNRFVMKNVLRHFESGSYNKSAALVAICDEDLKRLDAGPIMKRVHKIFTNQKLP
ncbi:beta-1,3-galactosyltransferase 1-like, partial [Argonauta hians]